MRFDYCPNWTDVTNVSSNKHFLIGQSGAKNRKYVFFIKNRVNVFDDNYKRKMNGAEMV